MFKRFFLENFNKYTSKWLVLFIDVCLVLVSFVFAYLIRFNLSLNFDSEILFSQIPVLIVISLVSFLIVGSYKGIIRHTGTKDAFNVFWRLHF
jgi:FlaA1/EpsC-like NDP-sugar epimerase